MNLNATVIGQSIAFALFAYFCMKVVWPPLVAVLEERRKKIIDGLEAAERAQRDLAIAQEKAGEDKDIAKREAAEILEQAKRRANQIVEEAKDQARVEGERILAAASAEIEQQSNRAKEALREQVALIAIAGAEKILQKSIDQAANEELLKGLAAEL